MAGRNGKPKALGYFNKKEQVARVFPTRLCSGASKLGLKGLPFGGRRNGKPTSLGCFDHEEQAARAYDKMMLWCELHNSSGVKGGITNFDPTEYEKDLQHLSSVTQVRSSMTSVLGRHDICPWQA